MPPSLSRSLCEVYEVQRAGMGCYLAEILSGCVEKPPPIHCTTVGAVCQPASQPASPEASMDNHLLHWLTGRETGEVSPRALVRLQALRRAYSLELSGYREFACYHATITCLDLDLVEAR